MRSRRKFFSAIVAGTGTAILPHRKETPQNVVAVMVVDDDLDNHERQLALEQYRSIMHGYGGGVQIQSSHRIEYVPADELERRLRNG